MAVLISLIYYVRTCNRPAECVYPRLVAVFALRSTWLGYVYVIFYVCIQLQSVMCNVCVHLMYMYINSQYQNNCFAGFRVLVFGFCGMVEKHTHSHISEPPDYTYTCVYIDTSNFNFFF